ncbi:hypothetical protein CPB84DRAFT_1849834 [Gymnopilus junonius]|uniref:Uncharacterized protein n=1 Tax=Gymnopilus junonius TaxID=109634 RepID=A0A9P5NI01_GYMJU|nr:hypothetical protein CPB84DRAFT_1849834 [Gymnopilus junonius]
MVLEVLGENLFGLIKLHKNNGVRQADRKADPPRTRIIAVVPSIPISSWKTCSSALTMWNPSYPPSWPRHPPPPAPQLTRLMGPLLSPSFSFGDSPMLDKWAFGMSKIEGDDSMAKSSTSMDKDALMTQRMHPPSQSTDLAAEVTQVSLDTHREEHGSPAGIPRPTRTRTRQNPYPFTRGSPRHGYMGHGYLLSHT